MLTGSYADFLDIAVERETDLGSQSAQSEGG